MDINEFTKRTGFEPTAAEYSEIEKAYYDFKGDKDDFCRAFVGGLGPLEHYKARAIKINELENKIKEMNNMFLEKLSERDRRIAILLNELEAEQEWKPYENIHNVTQADYSKLAEGADIGKSSHYMSDKEAIEWICEEFGFDPSKIQIIHEIDEYEINRHCQLRKTGYKIDRRPIYSATDSYYVRFNTPRNFYEAWNGNFFPFYD